MGASGRPSRFVRSFALARIFTVVAQGPMVSNPSDPLDADLLDAVFDAAGDERCWPEALGRVAREVDAKGAMYCLFAAQAASPAVEGVHFSGFALGSDLAYATRHNQVDPHVPVGMATPLRRWFLSHEHFDADFIQRNDFMREVMAPVGVRWVAGSRLWERDGVIGCLAFQRATDARPFTLTDRAMLEAISPHLARATLLHDRLRRERIKSHAGLAALEGLGLGLALVDAARRVQFANRAAECWLARSDVFTVGSGLRLAACDGAANARLSAALERALRGHSSSVPVGDRAGRLVVLLHVLPLPAGSGWNRDWQRPMAMLVFGPDRNDPRFDPELLRELFSLTAAEAALAVFLAGGGRLREFAASRGVSHETARSQLRALMAKSGVHRQSELVALIVGLAHPV